MRDIPVVLMVTGIALVAVCIGARGDVWIETTQADFADGEAVGGLGANLYASASGDVRMVGNNWDLNQDDYRDIVFANCRYDGTFNIYSYIYWGSSAGFNPSFLDSLPTQGAAANSVADLDRDGYLDIVFSNRRDSVTYNIHSYIYWGSSSGYDPMNVDSLPTHDPYTNSVADLNGDGYLDIIFSNCYDDLTRNIHSYIYWGSGSGYSAMDVDSLPTRGAIGNSVADLNEDGYLEIVFCNFNNDVTHNIHSYIYWGSASGYSPANMDSLPTHGALGTSVADLDGDGYLDIVFSNSHDDVTHNIHSYIYWGSASGYSTANVDSLPTHCGYGNSLADLDEDGYLDIVFSNCRNDSTHDIHSYIYWGSASGYNPANVDSLPTHGTHGNSIGDLDGDGWKDIVFSNLCNDSTYSIYSYIYWGSSMGYSSTLVDSLPTQGAHLSTTKDLGNVSDRDTIETYVSSVLDAGQGAEWGTLNWIAQVPSGSSLSMEVRTGGPPAPDPTWSGWVAVAQGGNIPDTLDSQCIQYRALMGTNYMATPVLEEVIIDYRLVGIEEVGAVRDERQEPGLLQNCPNPFVRQTAIGFVLRETGDTKLEIYDVSGRLMAILVEGRLNAGLHRATWTTDGAPSGIYFCKVTSGSLAATKKMVVAR